MRLYLGIASYGRPSALRLALKSAVLTKAFDGFLLVVDARSPEEAETYRKAIEGLNQEIRLDLNVGRRGSTTARNRLLDMAEKILDKDDVLIIYDDDDVLLDPKAPRAPLRWLVKGDVGLVGGRVVNLRRRAADPDFYLNAMPGLADVLTSATGFIFVDVKHGPRYVKYTTRCMALRGEVIHKGVRYDMKYGGTAYREESDFQEQVRKLGYRIVFDPTFYVYHIGYEVGGNRDVEIEERFYWKAKNNVYFTLKNRLGMRRLILSEAVILTYSLVYGIKTARRATEGLTEGLMII